ncbi:MAG: hypothetical protein JNL83_30270 [Myxococcales bacterium]|nr:hypothetical protein [Myxococcales bacterium]
MWGRVDDVLRFVYVLLAPALMVALGHIVPIGGIVISTGIATAITTAAELPEAARTAFELPPTASAWP